MPVLPCLLICWSFEVILIAYKGMISLCAPEVTNDRTSGLGTTFWVQNCQECQIIRCQISGILLYVGMILTNENCMCEKHKSRWNLGYLYYHVVWNFLSSHVLSNNAMIKICRIMIMHVVVCGYTAWCVILREGQRLRLVRYLCACL